MTTVAFILGAPEIRSIIVGVSIVVASSAVIFGVKKLMGWSREFKETVLKLLAVAERSEEQVAIVASQVTVNGGTSLADALVRIEGQLESIQESFATSQVEYREALTEAQSTHEHLTQVDESLSARIGEIHDETVARQAEIITRLDAITTGEHPVLPKENPDA